MFVCFDLNAFPAIFFFPISRVKGDVKWAVKPKMISI